MRFAVTMARKGGLDLSQQAQRWAGQLGVDYLPRREQGSLQQVLEEQGLEALLVATTQGPQLVSAEGTFFYHPSMAVLRLQRLKEGQGDNYVRALDLRPGLRVLDCTLGLASDAAIASYVVGPTGRVVGVEASTPLHFTVSRGLQHYVAEDEDLTAALRRITTVNATAADYLARCEADSFDVVYFDPMFRYPVNSSSCMEPLRPVAYVRALDPATVEEALRVAPRVVIKERGYRIFEEYGCQEVQGGRYSKVKYGIRNR